MTNNYHIRSSSAYPPAKDTKIRLASLSSLINENDYNENNIQQLAKYCAPSSHPSFQHEIYAILPIASREYRHSLVLYKQFFCCIERNHQRITRSFLETYHYLNFEDYQNAMQTIKGEKSYISAIATPKYSLMPLGSPQKRNTIWINPAQITTITDLSEKTTIRLSNSFLISTDRRRRGIYSRMERSHMAQAILKREVDDAPTHLTTPLLEYLEIPSTPANRSVLQKFQFQHIPGFSGDFAYYYQQFSLERAEQELMRRLDISP